MEGSNFITNGYEPKTLGNTQTLYSPLAGMRIPDSLIKVLPKFSHSLVDRRKFRENFPAMLKGIQGEFMMENVKVASSEFVDQRSLASPGSKSTAQRFFSPRKERNAIAPEEGGDGRQGGAVGVVAYPSPHANAGAQRPLLEGVPTRPPLPAFSPVAFPTGGVHTPTSAYVADRPSGYVPRGPGYQPTMAIPPPTEGSFIRSCIDTAEQSAVDPQPLASPIVEPPLTRQRLQQHNRGEARGPAIPPPLPVTAPPGMEQGEWDDSRQVHEASSGITSIELDAISLASYASHASSSLPSTTSTERVRQTEEWKQERAQIYDQMQHLQRMMTQQLAQQQANHQRQVAELTAALQNQSTALSGRLNAAIVGIAKAGNADLYVETGAEDWLVDATIKADFYQPYIWWSVRYNRPEDKYESSLRTRVFTYLKEHLPKSFWKSVPNGDVKAIYRNVIALDVANSNEQAETLWSELHAFKRGSLPMREFFDKLYEFMDQLEILQQPAPENMIRQIIIKNIVDDKRYAEALRDIRKQSQWGTAEIRVHLEAAASRHKDLLDSSDRRAKAKKAREKRKKAKAVRKAKKTAQPVASAGTESPPDPKVNAAQAAFPTQNNKEVERKVANEKKAREGQNLCNNYLYGSCKQGDACPRKHMSIEQLIERRDELKKVGGARANVPPKGTPSGTPKPSRQPCNRYFSNGECSYGEVCRYSHDPKDKPKAKSVRAVTFLPQINESTSDDGSSADRSEDEDDGESLLHACKHAYLPQGKNARVKKVRALVGASSALHRVTEPTPSHTEAVSVEELAGASAQQHNQIKVQRYLANGIFDTGANIGITGKRALLRKMRKLSKPLNVGVVGGTQATATHIGWLDMLLGERVIPMKMYFCAEEENTIIPGSTFGKDGYYFLGINNVLHLGYNFKPLVMLPREIKVDKGQDYPEDFMTSVEWREGKAQHTLYPIPDSCFIWPGEAKIKKGKSKGDNKKTVIASHYLTLSAANGAPNPKRDSIVSTLKQQESGEVSNTHEYLSRAMKDVSNFHHKSGHRSMEHTVRQYEWVYQKRLPKQAMDAVKPCSACGSAKIAADPFKQTALLSNIEIGEVLAADTIVGLPKSHSGYQHCLHYHDVASNYGGVRMGKTKSSSYKLVYWMKWLANKIGRTASTIKIDDGELNTTELQGHCEEHGIRVLVNLTNIHSNHTIERRHRTLEDMWRALMQHGGAGPILWEYAVPAASSIINLTLAIKALREVGRYDKSKVRPLTPFEKVENHGKPCDLSVMWDNLLGLFQAGTAKKEKGASSHENPGFEMVYLGPVPDDGVISRHGHLVLNRQTMKVESVRTVKLRKGEYPLRPAPHRLPSALVASPSGGECKGKPDTECKGKPTNPTLGKAAEFPPGTRVMTTSGPCIVVARYRDGDYCLRWDNDSDAQEAFSVPNNRNVFWSRAKFPDTFVYDFDGNRLDKPKPKGKHEPRKRGKPMGPAPPAGLQVPPASPTGDAPAHGTRSKTKLKSKTAKSQKINLSPAYRYFDHKYKHGVRVMVTAPALPKVRRVTAGPDPYEAILPEGMPLDGEEFDLRKVLACDVERILPKHFHQTLRSPLRAECAKGEERELQDLTNREVLGDPIKRGPDTIVIGLMWVYAVKKEKDGRFKSIRSRLTLMGNQERTLLSKLDAYAPVAQMVTARLLIATHLHRDGILYRKLDVQNAYLNEDMRRIVHARLPPGYTIEWISDTEWQYRRLRHGERAPPDLCQPVLKALYGGMECGRIFWEAWVSWHMDDGFQIIHEERCYLCKRDYKGNFIKLAYHVDDNLVVACGAGYYEAYLSRLQTKFDIEEGPLEDHLGVLYSIDMEHKVCTMSQEAQVIKLLKLFGMENCKPVATPSMAGPPPSAIDCEEECVEPDEVQWDMQSFVGHLQWLHMCTRPDIGQPLKILSRFTTKFGKRHVHYAKHILRYLRGTASKALVYTAGLPLKYEIFTDASHASCVDTRRSILSIVVKLGGMTVYWKNCFSTIVSHSSTESELYALDLGATVGQCLRWLLESTGGPVQDEIMIFVDNQGTIDIASNPVQAGRNVHVHARYFYVRDLVYDNQFAIHYLPTDEQVADVGCTFKGGPAFLKLREYLLGTASIVHSETCKHVRGNAIIINDSHCTPRWEIRKC